MHFNLTQITCCFREVQQFINSWAMDNTQMSFKKLISIVSIIVLIVLL